MTPVIENFSRDELIDMLSILRWYKIWLFQVGLRSFEYQSHEGASPLIQVEYPVWMDVENLKKPLLSILENQFSINSLPDSVIYRASTSLIWGIRMFVGDDMVDVTFQKFEFQIKK